MGCRCFTPSSQHLPKQPESTHPLRPTEVGKNEGIELPPGIASMVLEWARHGEQILETLVGIAKLKYSPGRVTLHLERSFPPRSAGVRDRSGKLGPHA